MTPGFPAGATGRSRVVPAAYVALVRGEGADQQVLLQLRRGTGFMDGWWACGAAGHVEHSESVLEAAAREAVEELGVTVDPADLSPLCTVHRTCAVHDPAEERVDMFFTAERWAGEPRIIETHKAAELRWFLLDALPADVVPHEHKALDALRLAGGGAPPAVLTHGFDQRLTLVAAVGRNGAIGDGSSMPWHLPEDLAHFKRTTGGGVMVMGRRTWDSIGRALPGRRTVVVTRDRTWSAPGAQVAHSMAEALLIAGDGEVFIAGGGEIYAQTLPWAHRLVITEVDAEPAVDVVFPPIDGAVWREVAREPRDGFAFVTWERTEQPP